jgi:hypothetical protein
MSSQKKFFMRFGKIPDSVNCVAFKEMMSFNAMLLFNPKYVGEYSPSDSNIDDAPAL